MRFLSKDFALLFLRVSVSAMMLLGHGAKKIMDPASYINFISMSFKLGALSVPLAWASILAETLFPLLIMLGILTRISSLIAAINMLVAVFAYHIAVKGDPFLVWEKPALFAVVFIYLAMVGGGRYAVIKS